MSNSKINAKSTKGQIKKEKNLAIKTITKNIQAFNMARVDILNKKTNNPKFNKIAFLFKSEFLIPKVGYILNENFLDFYFYNDLEAFYAAMLEHGNKLPR